MNAASARHYGEALAQLADQGEKRRHAYEAACAAVLAGAGQGADAGKLDDQQRAEFRRLALTWLQAELDLFAKPDHKAKTPRPLRFTLESWKLDVRLAGVRDAAGLAGLADAEAKAWRLLWAAVDQMLVQERETRSNEAKKD